MQVLKNNPILGHITTFGGHPVSCAASLATLKVIQKEIDYFEMNEKAGKIREIFLNISGVSEVRGKGMMMAAQMDDFGILKKNIDRLIDLGVITDWFLYCDNAMRIAPPLNISWEEIEWLKEKTKIL